MDTSSLLSGAVSSTLDSDIKSCAPGQVSVLPKKTVVGPHLSNTASEKTSEVVIRGLNDDNRMNNSSTICEENCVGGLFRHNEELNEICVDSQRNHQVSNEDTIIGVKRTTPSPSFMSNSQLHNQITHSIQERGHVSIGINAMLDTVASLLSERHDTKVSRGCPLCSYKNSDPMFVYQHLYQSHLSSDQTKSEMFHCLHCKFISIPVTAPYHLKQHHPSSTGHCQLCLSAVSTATTTHPTSLAQDKTLSPNQIDIEFSSHVKVHCAILSDKCGLKSLTTTTANERTTASVPKILLGSLPEKILEKPGEALAGKLNPGNEDSSDHRQVSCDCFHNNGNVKLIKEQSLDCFNFRGPWLNCRLICKIIISSLLGSRSCHRFHSPICPYHTQTERDLKQHFLKYHLASPRCNDGFIVCPHCSFRCDSDKDYREHFNLKHGSCLLCPHCSRELTTINEFDAHLNEHISPFDKLKSIDECNKVKKKTCLKPQNPNKVSLELSLGDVLIPVLEEADANGLRAQQSSNNMRHVNHVTSDGVEPVENINVTLSSNCLTGDTTSDALMNTATLTNRLEHQDLSDGTRYKPSSEGRKSKSLSHYKQLFLQKVDLHCHMETNHSFCYSIKESLLPLGSKTQQINNNHVDYSNSMKSSNLQSGGFTKKQTDVFKPNKDGSLEVPPSKCLSGKKMLQKSFCCKQNNATKSMSFYKKGVTITHGRRVPSVVLSGQQQKRRICLFCEVSYQSGFKLFFHMMTQHVSHLSDKISENIKCPHCHCTFVLDHQFSEHMNVVHGRGYCHQCPFKSTKKQLLLDHIVSTHFEDFIEVAKEKRIFVKADTIGKKLQVHQRMNFFRLCPFCPQVVTCPRILQRHLFRYHLAAEHSAQGKIKCGHCSLEFLSDIVYRMHIRIMHDREGIQHCPFCPCNSKHLTSHIIETHGAMIPILKCVTREGLTKSSSNGEDTDDRDPPAEPVSTSSLLQNNDKSNQPLGFTRESNALLIHTHITRKMRQVDRCCCHGGDDTDGSDSQVLHYSCSTAERIFDSSTCKPGELQDDSLEQVVRGHNKTFTKCSNQATWFQKKTIVAYVTMMFEQSVSGDHPNQQCPFCKAQYQYEWMLYLHMMIDHVSLETDRTVMKKKCPHCEECFSLDEQFFSHKKSIHYSDDHNCCPYCPFTSPILRVLYDHSVSTHFIRRKKVKCSHRVIVSAEKINKTWQLPQQLCELRLCPFCPFKTKALHVQRALVLHFILFHLASEQTAKSQIKCCHCSLEFQSDIQYRMHIKAMHNENGFQYCPFCHYKGSCLHPHLVVVHGSTIVMPNSLKDTSSVQESYIDDQSIQIPPKSFSRVPNKRLLVGQEQHISQQFGSSRNGKTSVERDDSSGTGIPPLSTVDHDQRPVKRHKIGPVDSITSNAAPQFDAISNQSLTSLLTAVGSSDTITKHCVPGQLYDRLSNDPNGQVLTTQSNMDRLTNSDTLQKMKEQSCQSDDTRQCPYCKQSISLDEMNEHFIAEHGNRDFCTQGNIKYRSVDELFSHTWNFHFKMLGKQSPSKTTVYLLPTALRQVLRKVLLELCAQNSPQIALIHCPLCSFVCKKTYNLKMYLSHHLVLHHLVPVRRYQNNNINCPHCSAKFVSESVYRHHLKVQHSASHTFYCPFCPFKCAAHLSFLLHDVTAIHSVDLLLEIRLDAKELQRDSVACATTCRPCDFRKRECGSKSNVSLKKKLHPRVNKCVDNSVEFEVEVDGLSPHLVNNSIINCLGNNHLVECQTNSFSYCNLCAPSTANTNTIVKSEVDWQSSFCYNHEPMECTCYDVLVKSESDYALKTNESKVHCSSQSVSAELAGNVCDDFLSAVPLCNASNSQEGECLDENSQEGNDQHLSVSCPRCPYVTNEKKLYEDHLCLAHGLKR